MRLVLLAVLLLLSAGAFAATYPDQGAAYTACMTDLGKTNLGTGVNPYTVARCALFAGPYYRMTWNTGDSIGQNTYYYDGAKTCSTRPAATSGWSSLGNGGNCNDGCMMGPATSAEKQTIGGTTYFSLAGAKATGGVCGFGDGSGTGVKQDTCTQVGTLTQCMGADGRMCAVSSSGKKFCWSGSEAGTKSSGNEAATKSPASANINAPSSKPSNGGDWSQTGQGGSSTTAGGTTTNYNVTNWTSTYGTSGNGGGAEGEGDGDGDDDGDGDAAGAGIGDLYEGEGKTVASVFADFKGKISDAPIMSAADGFLGSCGGGGGSCPNETWDGGDYAGQFDLGQLCTGPLAALFQYAGYVFLACIGIVAFRWALL